VKVQITTGRDKNALSVPVTALVARAGEGYAVEVADRGGERHLVPVTLGMFDQAGGLVGIEGSQIRAGQQVVVPGS
jgi:multidrug efflux pump subunit AcrA (membrane-fusion protein)